jgi:hypothetical protein
MERMPGRHTAENIKEAIEMIVNRYDFNKKRIRGIVFWSYLILFEAILLCMYVIFYSEAFFKKQNLTKIWLQNRKIHTHTTK